eukprot:3766527-Rhodomonas_salina.1
MEDKRKHAQLWLHCRTASDGNVLSIQGDIQLGLNRKSVHTVEFELEPIEAEQLSEQEAEEEHARRTSVDAAQDSMMVHGDKI